MTVNIAFGTRAHAYSLARYLKRHSMLGMSYTYCPAPLIDADFRKWCRTFPYLHTGLSAMHRLKLGALSERLSLPAANIYDKWVASKLKPADVFMAMSGLGLYSRRAARKMGSMSVCDRGSTHIRYQDELLAEEHDLCGLPYTPIPRGWVKKEESEYEEADLVVAQSTFAHRSFIAKGFPEKKIAWISPGVDVDMFSPGPGQDGVFRILCLGQISLRKGTRYLLEAVSSLRNPRIELVLAGVILPEAQEFLRRFEGKFRYAGRPGGKTELRDLYRQASVFVLPSIEDGFGLVLHEAMGCGVPIIATTNTGAPDLIEEGRQGFVVPIRSPQALAERISYLYERPGLAKEMGQEALKNAQGYSWDRYGERVVDLYKRRLAARAASTTA